MIWRTRKSPFDDQSRRIVHATYHKMGTTWLTRVLEGLASQYKWTVQKCNCVDEQVKPDSQIVIANHSQLDWSRVGDFVGSHLIRDPRDVVVSGYFYHRWTDEFWVHQPREEFAGQTYQQHLNAVDQSEGLMCEIRRFAEYVDEYRLRDWNYQDPRFLELKYEQLIEDEEYWFGRLFAHFGFSERAVRDGIRLTRKFGFEQIKKRTSPGDARHRHLRSGKVAQWREVLEDQHRREFKKRLGDLLVQQGYETGTAW